MIEFREISLDAKAPDPSNGGLWKSVPLVQRIDPLTQRTSRILTGVKLQPESPPDLSKLIEPGAFCPFCDGTLENVTFPFETDLLPEGRLRRNRAAIVPNLMAYSAYSSVGVYDSSRHFLTLGDFTKEVLFDAFSVMVDHALAVRRARPDLMWSSISANYLPPSGSSVLHPHLQSSHDFEPMHYQRELYDGQRRYFSANSRSYFDDLIKQERSGPRFIGTSRSVSWITPFAPRGFQEIWGVFENTSDITELSDDLTEDLSSGLERILRYYDSKNFSSFNYALTNSGPEGATVGSRLIFRILVRSNPDLNYRSDVTYFERLLDEPLVDVAPELVAAEASSFFV